MKCRLCKTELESKAKVWGMIDTANTKPFLFHDELYECPSCHAKYRKEFDLDKFARKKEIRYKTTRIANELFNALMKRLGKNNKEVLENHKWKIEMYKELNAE